VVSDSAQRLDGLERYLRDEGVATRGTRSLDRARRRFATVEGVVVIPKPAWGRAILDAVRTTLDPAE
jgi:hypothetical protein